ncbi:MAG: spermidine synthase [Gammaproteobacteria bacterium]|nr:spermidine synthase [Gammaproteobacteria bacterium]
MDSVSFHYESGSDDVLQKIRIKKCLYDGKTPFQQVSIYETRQYGKMLLLDGLIQSVESDEYRYHESLVHPAMCAHANPRNVLIIGGGEGATAREVLKHSCVEKVVMVDIDGLLIELCERYLSEWHDGAFSDTRLELIVQNGLDYVYDSTEIFDVIILDVCDGINKTSRSIEFFQKRFFTALKRILELKGIVAYQAMSATPGDTTDLATVLHGLNKVFTYANAYTSFIPSFAAQWGFVAASDVSHCKLISEEVIDNVLEARKLKERLRFFDGMTFRHMMSLPRDVRMAIEDDEVKSIEDRFFSQGVHQLLEGVGCSV